MAFEHLKYAFDCDRDLSTVAVLALHVLAHKMGSHAFCWPSYEYIGTKIRKSARTAYTACQELVQAGLLHIESGKERGGANRFRILIPEDYHLMFTAENKGHPKRFDPHWEENRRYVHNSPLVNKVGSPLHTPVGNALHTGVGKTGAKVGKIPPQGMKPVADNQSKQTEKILQQEMFAPDASAVLPPPENAYLPPTDTVRFRDLVRDTCYELGAPESVILRIYEHNRITNWSVLRKKTLHFALMNAVWYWMQREPKLFAQEDIRRFIEAHPEIATSANPEIS